MYAYSWFTLLHSTNEYKVVKPLYAIKKRKNYKANEDDSTNELNE